MEFIASPAPYDADPLDADALGDDPLAAARRWLDEAIAADAPQPDAMCLATATKIGRPSVRAVLVKRIDDGLVFFTNYDSRKGGELTTNPWAAGALVWPTLHRQIRAAGRVERTSATESDAYFATRPRGAQIAAAASAQSRVLASREELEMKVASLEEEYPGEVPRPGSWGGFRLFPMRMEFWQGRIDRLHDRVEFVRHGEGWMRRLLWP